MYYCQVRKGVGMQFLERGNQLPLECLYEQIQVLPLRKQQIFCRGSACVKELSSVEDRKSERERDHANKRTYGPHATMAKEPAF